MGAWGPPMIDEKQRRNLYVVASSSKEALHRRVGSVFPDLGMFTLCGEGQRGRGRENNNYSCQMRGGL